MKDYKKGMYADTPFFCAAYAGMTSFLYKQKMRIFDYKQQFVQPLRDAIIHNAEQIARDNCLTIEYLKKKNFRKEDRVAEILKKHEKRTIRDLNLGSIRVWIKCSYRKIVCEPCSRIIVEDLDF